MKMRLVMYIGGQSLAELDLATVFCDDIDDLGKWIYGPDTHHVSISEIKTLRQSHTAVQLTAGAIFQSVQQHNPEQARMLSRDCSRT